MQAIIYYLSLPFIYLIAWLPFPIMYLLSDVVYFLLFYVVGYRKKVVRKNLENAFPEKSADEISVITKRFYAYFCDLILETLKTLTITPPQVEKRVAFDQKDLDVVMPFLEAGQSITVVMGHWGNWELAGARWAISPLHKLAIIYHPLKNPYFERLIIRMRTRLGNRLYPANQTIRCMVADRREKMATAFIADQTPHNLNTVEWLNFLNQDTAVFVGTERLSAKFKNPVVYIGMHRIKRGFYKIECELLTDEPQNLPPSELTRIHTQRLEQDIIAQPETWLWTHRRWKHVRTEGAKL